MVILGGYGVATGGPLAWGLCYNKEMSPSQTYCDDFYKYTYPCTPGAEYYGRGAIPIFWYVTFLCVYNLTIICFFISLLLTLLSYLINVPTYFLSMEIKLLE